MSVSPQAMKISRIKVGQIEKKEYGHDRRKIGCQLRVGFYHTPSITGVTGYTMGDEGGYPRAAGVFT